MRRRTASFALALAPAFALALLVGCGETPAQGFERFYDGVASGSDEAYARLSTRAQAQFAAAGPAKGKDPARFLVSAVPKSTVRSIDVVEEHGDSAVVEVKDALGNKERVSMVKESGKWRV